MINKFDIIIQTLVTEKTTKDEKLGKYFFEVDKLATKKQIKKAIESIFDIVVENVNIVNYDGKIKGFRNNKGRRKATKKAIVTLKKGQNINMGKLE